MDWYVAAVTVFSGAYELLKLAVLVLGACALVKYLRSK